MGGGLASALIIGGDGTIGCALSRALSAAGLSVYATTRREDVLGRRRIQLDLAGPEAPEAPLPAVDVAVFCAAMARFAECRMEPARARRVNVEAPLRLARRLVGAGSRVVLLSTSAVFDGKVPRRHAADAPSPTTAYGRLKAEAEAGFLALGAAASVFRLTKIVTPQMPLFAGWIEALAVGRTVEAFADLRFCPLTLDDAIGTLMAALRDAGGGIYQVSGASDISYAEAALHLAKRCGAGSRSIHRTLAVEHGIPTDEILLHTSLDASRLSHLTGFAPPQPFSVLDAVFAPLEPAARVTGG